VTREEFEHVIRVAAALVRDEIVVVGSQAVLAEFPNAPDSLLRSQELDVYPRSNPELAGEIDAVMGDGSQFHAVTGYYAHGVGPETVQGPAGWEGRLKRLDLPAIRKRDGTAVAWCLEVHDLVLAKLAAGREHDLVFSKDAIHEGLVDVENLRRGVELMPEDVRSLVEERLEGLVSQLAREGAN